MCPQKERSLPTTGGTVDDEMIGVNSGLSSEPFQRPLEILERYVLFRRGESRLAEIGQSECGITMGGKRRRVVMPG